MFLSLDFLLLLCEFSIVLDKVFSISGGKYIIEVDVRCDSGIAVSICCQKGSSPESPEFSWSEMDVCRFTRFDCLFSRSPPTPPPWPPNIFSCWVVIAQWSLKYCTCAVEFSCCLALLKGFRRQSGRAGCAPVYPCCNHVRTFPSLAIRVRYFGMCLCKNTIYMCLK